MTTTDYQASVLSYFEAKAEEYDLVEEQAYWRLSDALLWSTFDELVLRRLPQRFSFLDAGGGTGRWSERVLKNYPESRGLLYDLSKDMAAKAQEKRERNGFEHRFHIQNGMLEEVEAQLAGAEFDLIFNFHNVLGFVKDVDEVLRQLAGAEANVFALLDAGVV
jgi:ubiquinone/menaquinone biosynthesis C-methylase UbiE